MEVPLDEQCGLLKDSGGRVLDFEEEARQEREARELAKASKRFSGGV